MLYSDEAPINGLLPRNVEDNPIPADRGVVSEYPLIWVVFLVHHRKRHQGNAPTKRVGRMRQQTGALHISYKFARVLLQRLRVVHAYEQLGFGLGNASIERVL